MPIWKGNQNSINIFGEIILKLILCLYQSFDISEYRLRKQTNFVYG